MERLDYGRVIDGAERNIGFYLPDSFSMLPLISAMEPLRIANRLSKRRLYQWRTVSDNGESVRASNGMMLQVDHPVPPQEDFSLLVVLGPFYPERSDNPLVLDWLREEVEKGTVLAGLETGCHLLADAGLLDGLHCTTHWESMAQFKETWPHHRVSMEVYEVDQRRLTCSGGAASMDMMLYVIEQHHGHELAASVSDSMIHPHIRHGWEPQRMDIKSRTGVTHPDLIECIELIEANIEQPLTPAELAGLVGISKRQLERLFRRYLNTTPARYYLALRLETARRMLENSTMKIIDVAIACGFKSAGHFSSRYYSSFGVTPRESRKER